MFYTSKYVTEAVCHSVVGVLLIFALSLAMGGQRAGRRGVLGCDRAEEPMNIQTYQKAIKEEWFSCTTAFVALAVLSPVVFPTSFAESLSARAILLCNYFGLVESHKKRQCSRTVSGLQEAVRFASTVRVVAKVVLCVDALIGAAQLKTSTLKSRFFFQAERNRKKLEKKNPTKKQTTKKNKCCTFHCTCHSKIQFGQKVVFSRFLKNKNCFFCRIVFLTGRYREKYKTAVFFVFSELVQPEKKSLL
jgi:hypothetical protein